MLEKHVRVLSEQLARTTSRRTFIRDAGASIFGSMLALAAGQAFSGSASAAVPKPGLQQPACSPPGPYCNTGTGPLSGCQGAHCFMHLYNGQLLECYPMIGYPLVGCWTTPDAGGYWTCCDCNCGHPTVTSCGCAQFSLNPAPRPDSPVGVGA